MSKVDDVILKDWDSLESSQAILQEVDQTHAQDARACSSLPIEIDPSLPTAIAYEPIFSSNRCDRPMAVRSKGLPLLLDETSIQMLRSAAEAEWSHEEDITTSRFTIQRKGNSECHLDDLASKDGQIRSIVHELLLVKVYPWIRDAFCSKGILEDEDLDSLRFCVYDSLIIRYNATQASEGAGAVSKGGAGQPLHRDLGLISVNIMLNSDAEFVGGGTAFENQIDCHLEDGTGNGDLSRCQPLKPIGPGHAIAHLSSERHAGASTQDGVRDILVIFITATRESSGKDTSFAPKLERNARLKAAASPKSQKYSEQEGQAALCRAQYQRLAIESNPGDGEAWQYLGMALRDYSLYCRSSRSNKSLSNQMQIVQQASIDCLEYATSLTPCDGRLFNNLGLALGERYLEKINCLQSHDEEELYQKARSSYLRAKFLHEASKRMGCDVGHELDACILNHGLLAANLDQFHEAVAILSGATADSSIFLDETQDEANAIGSFHARLLRDIQTLKDFCQEQMAQRQLQKADRT